MQTRKRIPSLPMTCVRVCACVNITQNTIGATARTTPAALLEHVQVRGAVCNRRSLDVSDPPLQVLHALGRLCGLAPKHARKHVVLWRRGMDVVVVRAFTNQGRHSFGVWTGSGPPPSRRRRVWPRNGHSSHSAAASQRKRPGKTAGACHTLRDTMGAAGKRAIFPAYRGAVSDLISQ